MQRADGKLFGVLADNVCRGVLRCLFESGEPLTQRQLIAELGISSGVISRRMGELESVGLVARESSHAPYRLTFPEETQRLLVGGAKLAAVALDRLAQEAAEYAWSLQNGPKQAKPEGAPAEGGVG